MLLAVISFFALILVPLGWFKCQLISDFWELVSPMNPYHDVVEGSRVHKDAGTEKTVGKKAPLSPN